MIYMYLPPHQGQRTSLFVCPSFLNSYSDPGSLETSFYTRMIEKEYKQCTCALFSAKRL